jgi:hypothetical protein
MNKDDRAQAKAADARLTAKEKAEADKKAAKANQPKEIPIQRGFSNANPVDPEGKQGGEPIVEKGISPEDAADTGDKPKSKSKHHSKKSSRSEY